MKDKIKQWIDEEGPIMPDFGSELADIINDCIQDLGLSNEWVSVGDSKPSQGDRVLLKTKYDDNCPYVVGYWGCGTWEACTVNVEADKDYNGNQACVERAFSNDDVTHWQPLPLPPSEAKS